mmetsp:Transcript_11611/g.38197  ORF Transcript_11611/g.38197 Transcript_11611/m.38197 type:complete len:178 (-) Transcript_11611:88-621(-)
MGEPFHLRGAEETTETTQWNTNATTSPAGRKGAANETLQILESVEHLLLALRNLCRTLSSGPRGAVPLQRQLELVSRRLHVGPYPSSANSSSSRAVLLFDHFFSHLCHGRANRGELVDERGASGSATMGGDISGGGATRAVRGGGIASLRGAATRERRDELRWEAPRREDCSSTAAV